MTLPQNVKDALALIETLANDEGDYAEPRAVETIRAHLMRQVAEITRLTSGNLSYTQDNANLMGREHVALKRANLAESRLAAANALLLRYCVQVGELTKGLDPNDPIYFDIQRLGAYYMTHLQGAGDEVAN